MCEKMIEKNVFCMESPKVVVETKLAFFQVYDYFFIAERTSQKKDGVKESP